SPRGGQPLAATPPCAVRTFLARRRSSARGGLARFTPRLSAAASGVARMHRRRPDSTSHRRPPTRRRLESRAAGSRARSRSRQPIGRWRVFRVVSLLDAWHGGGDSWKPLPFNATIRSNQMKTKLVLGAVAAAVAVFSQGAFAQAASSPTRAEVKAEAKKGALAPAGEATGSVTPGKGSNTTREERKATTKADRASGNLKATGEAGDLKGTQPGKGSEVDRAARKADTKAAVKAGKTQPA